MGLGRGGQVADGHAVYVLLDDLVKACPEAHRGAHVGAVARLGAIERRAGHRHRGALDRAQHVAEVILPALQRGAVVITDRYLDSSLAYQAGGRELTAAEIRNLSMWATNGLLPERTYLLDMDPAQSHARLQHAEDRMEAAGNDFQRRTRVAFLDLAEREPERFHVIDASQSIEDVWARIKADFDTVSTADGGIA